MRLRCGASCTSGSSACVEDGCGGTYGMPSVISPPVTGLITYLLNNKFATASTTSADLKNQVDVILDDDIAKQPEISIFSQ